MRLCSPQSPLPLVPQRCLVWDPARRMTPDQALQHCWITGVLWCHGSSGPGLLQMPLLGVMTNPASEPPVENLQKLFSLRASHASPRATSMFTCRGKPGTLPAG